MTKYYVRISAQLVNSLTGVYANLPDGFRLIERWGPRGKDTETWLVEDDNAPPHLYWHMVNLTIGSVEGEPVIHERVIVEP